MSSEWIPLNDPVWPPISKKDKHRTEKVHLLLHCGKTTNACLWNSMGRKAGCCFATHWMPLSLPLKANS
jgi:hypothetical protein